MAIEHMAQRTITEYLIEKRILPDTYKDKTASVKKINAALSILYPDVEIERSTVGNRLHHLVDWCKYLGLEVLEKKPRQDSFFQQPVKSRPKKKRTPEEKKAARKSRAEKRESMLTETQYAAFIEKAKENLDYDYINSAEFLKSYAWCNLRYAKLVSCDNRCMCCGRSVKQGAVLNVDHIKPRRLFPELALEPSNLQVLCSECNKGKASASITKF